MAQKTDISIKIFIAFFLAFFAHIWQSIFLPNIHIHSFLPFLGFCFCLKDHYKALCLSILAGLIMDLLSTTKMGVWTLNFFTTALLTYPLRNHFDIEKPFHLAMYTTIIGFVSMVFHYIFLFTFDRCAPHFGKWIFSDFFIMPIIDGLYAVIWFSTILWAVENIRKKFKWKRR